MNQQVLKRNEADSSQAWMIPSDHLRVLNPIIAQNTIFKTFTGAPVVFRIVVDTSAILAEILWLCSSRENDNARSALQESIDAGVLIGFAPEKLEQELRKHLANRAAKRGISETDAWTAWAELRCRLTFVSDEVWTNEVVAPKDPDDVRFVALYQAMAADAVLSKDGDIPAMGAVTLHPDAIRLLRAYARLRVVDVSFGVSQVTICGAVTVSATGTAAAIKAIAARIASVPPLVLLGGGILLYFALRRFAKTDVSHQFRDALVNNSRLIVNAYCTFAKEAHESRLAAHALLESLEDAEWATRPPSGTYTVGSTLTRPVYCLDIGGRLRGPLQ